MKTGEPGVPSMEDWLAHNVASGQAVGVDPFTVSTASALSLRSKLEAKGVTLSALEHNLVDAVWTDRPAVPANPIRVKLLRYFLHPFANSSHTYYIMQIHAIEYAGVHHSEKIASLQSDLSNLGANALVVCALDELAWLLNIRGSDIHCNPVTFAYTIVTREKVYLFVDDSKLSAEVRSHLGEHVEVLPYGSITSFLSQYSGDLAATNGSIVADYNNVNWAVYQSIQVPVIDTPSLIERKKTIKNAAEIDVSGSPALDMGRFVE